MMISRRNGRGKEAEENVMVEGKRRMVRIFTIFLLCAAAFFMNIKEAYMSGSEYGEITLNDLILRSDLIIAAKTLEPSFIVEDVPIGEGRYPPFKKCVYSFEMVDLLYENKENMKEWVDAGGHTAPLAGKRIEVLMDFYDGHLDLEKKYWIEDRHKTKLFQSYKVYDQKLNKEKKKIIFLVYNKK
ncbi:MAG: hypothetical protein NTY34_07890, partial [Candidatus Omnitrophica bacterium]|nr:hypothetical protein [Candidatus Omnitrophota bacterium]